jgi:hypothetical protein
MTVAPARMMLDDAAVDVDAQRLGGGRLEGVPGVDADPAGAAVDGLGDVVGPFVGELGRVDVDGGRVLGEDRGPERPGGLGGLPGQDRPSAAGGHGPHFLKLPVSLLLHGISRFPFGQHVGLVLRQLVGRRVAGLGGGAGQDLIAGGASCGPPLLELFEQGHGPPRAFPT